MTRRPVGAVLGGRYRLAAVLGVGGSSIVYRGWDEELHRAVAVKVFFDRTDDPSSVARQRDELQVLARLHHPALVTLYDGQVAAPGSDEPGYLVLELVDGPSLTGLLRERRLGLPEIVAVGLAVAEALAHVHAHGIVHRDVKPGNVLIDAAGGAHLTDLGVLRQTGAETRTAVGFTLGTPAYLSPEQVEGAAVVAASDVYSLGLVLLEAATGRREYAGPTVEAALARLVRGPSVPAGLDPSLAALLAGMTSRHPGDRPTAQLVAERLRGWREADATTVWEAPAGADPTTGTRRRRSTRAAVVAVGALTLAAVLLVDTSTHPPATADPPPTRATVASPRLSTSTPGPLAVPLAGSPVPVLPPPVLPPPVLPPPVLPPPVLRPPTVSAPVSARVAALSPTSRRVGSPRRSIPTPVAPAPATRRRGATLGHHPRPRPAHGPTSHHQRH